MSSASPVTAGPASTSPHGSPAGSLAHLPITLFAAVMGIGGLGLAWRRAALGWGTPMWVADALVLLAAAIFLVLAALYAAKWARFPAAARAELRHPVRMSFAPTITISVLVLATGLQDLAPGLARPLWWLGAIGHLVATLLVISAWLSRSDIQLAQVTPAWFIPVVGNVITPLAAPALGSTELAWFAFGVGIMAWLALLPLVLHRLLLADSPLLPRLRPTLMILVAPPAVSLLALTSLLGGPLDPARKVLYGVAVFLTVLVVVQPGQLRLPFALSFLAYTFPLGALAGAAIAVDTAAGGGLTAYRVMAWLGLAAASIVVPLVVALTVRAAARGAVLVPE
ncbi:MAG: SLAC1 anion channel family protein [Candidatus Phosphoribacter sp.]|nr:SLAC1 anion channel family protein [Actinomycetales bacterium]